MAKELPPLCRVCGRPVPKHMTWKSWGFRDEDAPRSKTEAAARSNHPLVKATLSDSSVIGPYVQFATYWDGTYQWDGHFHAQRCAADFGVWAAGTDQLKDWAMQPYHDAMKARAAKETA